MTPSDQTIPIAAAPSAPAVDTSYRDAALPIEERVDALLGQMTLVEKAGLLFHPMIRMGDRGRVAGADEEYGILATARSRMATPRWCRRRGVGPDGASQR